MTQEKIEKIKKEIERLEAEYERASFGSMFDKSKQEHIYNQLRKKRKELEALEEAPPKKGQKPQ